MAQAFVRSTFRLVMGLRWMACLLIAGSLLAPLVASADGRKQDAKPPARNTANTPPDPKAVAAVNTAVAALLKEAQAGFKEGAAKDPANKLREKADYFGETPPAEITPDAILAALEKPTSPDPRADAYVKWELLSAVRGQFSEELATRAAAAYRRAPEPSSHPGLERNKLSSALFKVGAMNRENEGNVNKEFAKVVDKFTSDNHYILNYRNDLYARLPVSGDSLMAGIDDLLTRAKHGVKGAELFTQVGSSIRSWALSADRRQLDAVGKALGTLLRTVKDDHCKPYFRVVWADPAGLHWEDAISIGDAEIQDVINAVHDAGRK